MFRNDFRPGDQVKDSGVYWVHHYRHRTPHQARVKFAVFPECATCGDKVRYEPVDIAASEILNWLREDRDFTHAAGKIKDHPSAGLAN